MTVQKGPTTKEKLSFWVVISLLSVFFAEVLSGSQPFALVIPWNPMVLMPLYGIHTLLLARLVFKGKPTFTSLFAAGCIFGLYEAYITKVLFDPHWGASPFRFLGVDFLWILILVLWWHVFFAFIIPLLAGEILLTRSSEVQSSLPGPIRKALSSKKGPVILISIFVVWAALFMGSNMPAFWVAPISLGVNLIVLSFFIVLFRKKVGTRYSMRELLPDGKEFWILFSILLGMFLVFGAIWAPERMPGPFGHMIILSLYGLFFLLLYLNIEASKRLKTNSRMNTQWKIGFKIPLVLFFVFSIISVIMGITGIGVIFMVLSFIGGILLGIILLVRTIWVPARNWITQYYT